MFSPQFPNAERENAPIIRKLPRKRRSAGRKMFRMLVASAISVIGLATGGFGLEPTWPVAAQTRQLVASIADQLLLDPTSMNTLLAQSNMPALPAPVPLEQLVISEPPIESSAAAETLSKAVSGWSAGVAKALGIPASNTSPILSAADQAATAQAVANLFSPADQAATAQALVDLTAIALGATTPSAIGVNPQTTFVTVTIEAALAETARVQNATATRAAFDLTSTAYAMTPTPVVIDGNPTEVQLTRTQLVIDLTATARAAIPTRTPQPPSVTPTLIPPTPTELITPPTLTPLPAVETTLPPTETPQPTDRPSRGTNPTSVPPTSAPPVPPTVPPTLPPVATNPPVPTNVPVPTNTPANVITPPPVDPPTYVPTLTP